MTSFVRPALATLCVLVVGGAFDRAAQSPQESPSQRLAKIFEADQSDSRPYKTPEQVAATNTRARERRAQVVDILATGTIESGEDYYHAAMIFQHSATPEDHLTAHVLATIAGYKGHKRARWLSAAALDAYLQDTGKAQIFGTIYFRTGDRRSFDPAALSDALREGFCVPPLAEQEKNVELLRKGGSPLAIKRIASACEPVEAAER